MYKSTVGNRKQRNVLPTSCPYMVHLHRFYETASTIYLLLQYASGGKLWDYVGAYLRYAQEHAREGGSGAEDGYPVQNFQNVYTGFKIHTDDNQRKSFTKSEVVDNFSENEEKGNSKLEEKVSFNKDANEIVIGTPKENTVNELSIEDFQLDLEETTVKELDHVIEVDDTTRENRTQYNRYTSFSSEENIGDENDGANCSPAPFDRQNSQGGLFQDLLEKNTNKTALENFSINSFDSADGFSRMDSNVSDHIEVIHEVNEHTCDTDVFNCDNNTNSVDAKNMYSSTEQTSNDPSQNCDANRRDSNIDSDNSEEVADSIIKHSKELLRSVERTLSQIDNETPEESAKPVPRCSNNSPVNTTTSDTASIDSPEEPSIYDLHPHGDMSDSQSDSRSQEYDSGRPTSSEINVNDYSDLIVNDILSSTKDNLIDKDNIETDKRSRNESGSRSRGGSDVSKLSRQLSLTQINSTELSRSASSEYESKSPSKTRQKTISHLFEQLDMSTQHPDQVKIPESFIRRWAAEIIVALSTLHSLGIICRQVS